MCLSGQKDNVLKFFQNFRDFYAEELKAACPCEMRTQKQFCGTDGMSLADWISQRNQMLRAQKELKNNREKTGPGGGESESEDDIQSRVITSETDVPRIHVVFTFENAIESPAEMARRLACQSGAAWDRQQYEMIICCVWPLHRVWEYALTERRLKEWNSVEGRLQLIQDAQVPPVRVFAHGAGGSGKTYCLTKVVMAVFQWFMPGQCRKQTSTNSAARLIAGDTMHACAGLLKSAKFTAEEPSRKVQNKLKTTWGTAVFVYNDEVGAAAPGLYGTLSSRAYWGKRAAGQIEDVGPKQAPFGNPLLHVDAGDFAQLRPVPKGSPSLMEAFLMSRKDYANEGRVRPLTDMEMLGLKTFDLVAETCVEFKGTYRFKENDPLIRLLQIMRTVGGAEVYQRH